MTQLINQVYDLHSSTQASDYLQAAQTLIEKHRKRALVVLVTNIRPEDKKDLLAAYQLISKHHLVLIASLREEALDEGLHTPVENINSAINYAGTIAYLAERKRFLAYLQHQGAFVADSLPKHMHIAMVNQYLALKRQGRI